MTAEQRTQTGWAVTLQACTRTRCTRRVRYHKTAEVLTHDVEKTRFDQLQETSKQHPSVTHEGECYQSLGCWKERPNRAIPSLEGTDPRLDDSYGARSNPVEKCYQVAHSRGFTVFAVQNGGQCFGSANGHNTFFKYGRSSACGVDGEGGPWANDVYLIGVNVALGKPAFQTSQYKPTDPADGAASLAVDGNTDTNYHHGSCTHTVDSPGETNPSWWVDLGQSYVIDRVLIFNRQDTRPERINPFNIHIGDSDQVSANPKCGGYHQMNLNQPSISVSCQGMKGRYVGVRLPGPSRILTLCEVRVFLGRCAPMLLDNSAPSLYKMSSELVCRMGDGASYRGTVFMTETGKTCQRWDSQTPHEHEYTTAKFPSSGLEENYCRKTEDWTEVWCFTTDPSTRYEICDVPVCVVGHRRHGCKDGYIRLGQHCIRLVPILKSFVDAQQACMADGATLAMPKTKELDLALRRLVKTSGGSNDHWIGMKRVVDLDWTWVDGTLLGHYRVWNPGRKESNSGRKPPIVIKFVSYNTRNKIFTAKSKLKGSGMYITDHLTRENAQLLRETRAKLGTAWSFDGRIFCLVNGVKKKISCLEDLNSTTSTSSAGRKESNSGRKPPIVIKFVSYNTRNKIFTAKSKLKGSGMYITDHLTRENAQLLRETRAKLGTAWSFDGRIFCLVNGVKKKISCLEDLNSTTSTSSAGET
ncbi:uncharacterized protein LOC118420028 [Branchiostoma floridae]|uniref:Uncharacterized protein LOC118420028 n=1 Tax=Branchiostoma floridae TaxID=7739 RepID=A0A9J7LGW8_BRAFL|nr:uncharacterized protein LOC118420028 [Branchiostoma floridae]